MQTPTDLKHYKAPDAFQIITEADAGTLLLYLIALACIFEPIIRRLG